MNWPLGLALFFILWWVVFFAVLPFSLRTQAEEGEVTAGTVPSAPKGPHVLRAVLRTTVIAVTLFGVFLIMTDVFGFGIDDLPRIVPRFD